MVPRMFHSESRIKKYVLKTDISQAWTQEGDGVVSEDFLYRVICPLRRSLYL